MTELSGFQIMMPPGWSRYRANDQGKAQLSAKLAAKVKRASRPDLDVQLRLLINEQWRRLAATQVHSVYLPDQELDGIALLPMSIAMRQLTSATGAQFADGLRAFAKSDVETFDTAIGPILRWRLDSRPDGDLREIVNRTLGYGFPLPGDNQRRGLVFVASLPHLADTDPSMIDGMTELTDTIMETFRWR